MAGLPAARARPPLLPGLPVSAAGMKFRPQSPRRPHPGSPWIRTPAPRDGCREYRHSGAVAHESDSLWQGRPCGRERQECANRMNGQKKLPRRELETA
jgi:hypothetical protein